MSFGVIAEQAKEQRSSNQRKELEKLVDDLKKNLMLESCIEPKLTTSIIDLAEERLKTNNSPKEHQRLGHCL